VYDADVNAGKVKPEQIPKLSDRYIAAAHEVARERMFLAGQRLLTELHQSW
jgi:hypothetical protein